MTGTTQQKKLYWILSINILCHHIAKHKTTLG